MSILVFERVAKHFGELQAVEDLSFCVPEGGIFGFLGGNGAGKTTSLRMALDIIRPTFGQIEILGRRPGRENALDLGFLPEERGLYRHMTVLDTVIYFGRLKGMGHADARTAAATLIDRFALTERSGQKIGSLSKGMSQKVQLAAALVNTPRLLILDEPFSGLDPINQGVLEELVLEMARGGSTVIFSTHVMQHAERLCDRLLLMARGKKLFEGTQDQARQSLPGKLLLTCRHDPRGLPGILSAIPANGQQEWTEWTIALSPGATAESLLEYCTAHGFGLRRFEMHRPTLHDVFLHLVGGGETVQ